MTNQKMTASDSMSLRGVSEKARVSSEKRTHTEKKNRAMTKKKRMMSTNPLKLSL